MKEELMRTNGQKFLQVLQNNLGDQLEGEFEMVLSNDSDDRSGRVTVEATDDLKVSLCSFTYHFGPHSWFPIVLHTSGNANETITPFKWGRLDDALDAILARAKEQKKLRL
jgi:hypothetical protein